MTTLGVCSRARRARTSRITSSTSSRRRPRRSSSCGRGASASAPFPPCRRGAGRGAASRQGPRVTDGARSAWRSVESSSRNAWAPLAGNAGVVGDREDSSDDCPSSGGRRRPRGSRRQPADPGVEVADAGRDRSSPRSRPRARRAAGRPAARARPRCRRSSRARDVARWSMASSRRSAYWTAAAPFRSSSSSSASNRRSTTSPAATIAAAGSPGQASARTGPRCPGGVGPAISPMNASPPTASDFPGAPARPRRSPGRSAPAGP